MPTINKIKDYPETAYRKEIYKKTKLILHHTVGCTWQGTVSWWKQTPTREGTAYVIDKDGSIIQVFDPSYYAMHLFRHGSGEDPALYLLEKTTIGIEFVNEGPLTKVGDKYCWLDGKHEYKGEVFDAGELWQGFQYWAKYSDAQYAAAAWLIDQICKSFSIEKTFNTTRRFDKNNFNKNGIFTHGNFRADKSDVSIAFDFKKVMEVPLA